MHQCRYKFNAQVPIYFVYIRVFCLKLIASYAVPNQKHHQKIQVVADQTAKQGIASVGKIGQGLVACIAHNV